MASLTRYFIGVDVGTGSVRAGLVDPTGKVIRLATKEITIWNYGDFYEQSSDEIWDAVVFCIREVSKYVPKSEIKGIGFDATCSLVAIDTNGDPLTVSKSGNNQQNIIMWLDHRANKEAKFITKSNHDVLKFVGGSISLEMQTPKLLWLKKHLKEACWDKIGYFFDLPDFLTWKATECNSRSICSLVCKWTYEMTPNYKGWNEAFFRKIGLEDLLSNDAKIIGNLVHTPGYPVGNGLSKNVAAQLSLSKGTAVATSIIDAHAGGLGLLGCRVSGIDSDFKSRLCLICGTSTCHMALSDKPIFTKGVWGPYYNAMVPDHYLSEGGQSVTGKLIEYVIETHPVTASIKKKLPADKRINQYLNELLNSMAKARKFKSVHYLSKDIHVYPDFYGNRSPVGDPSLKGSICGLDIEKSEENLAILYLATIQSLAYGTRHIIESMRKSGYTNLNSIVVCGGLSKNDLFLRAHADITNLPTVNSLEIESVIIGAAILAAYAAGEFNSVQAAVNGMGGVGRLVLPDNQVQEYHEKKYQVFLKMLDDQMEYREMMKGLMCL